MTALSETFFEVRAGAKRREADIYRLYDGMRRMAPLWRSPWGDVYLSSFELVDRILMSRAVSHALRPSLPNRERQDSQASAIGDWLMFMDGAAHAQMRRALQGPFVGTDGGLARRVAAIVDDHMAAVALDHEIDAVALFTRAIPEKVIGGMLGMPVSDLPRLRAWAQAIRTTLDTGMESAAAGDADATTELCAYFTDALKRSTAVGDFEMRPLIDAVGLHDAAANLGFLAFAGYETTVHLLASMLLHLSRSPLVWNAIRENPEIAPTVVAEVLRLESPVQKVCRRALADIELSSSERVRKDEYLVLLLGAANRDPARFPKPDRIDLSQTQSAHLGFGKGLHSCLGRGLAMMEGTALSRWLIGHVGAIETGGIEPEWIANSSFRGLERLPLTLRS